MLIEYRKLIFPDREMIEAITAHDAMSAKILSSGTISEIEIDESPELKFAAKLKLQDGGEKRVDLDYSYVVAAMVRYCIDHKVPLPRRGEKLIELDEGRPALCIQMSEVAAAVKDDESYYVLL